MHHFQLLTDKHTAAHSQWLIHVVASQPHSLKPGGAATLEPASSISTLLSMVCWLWSSAAYERHLGIAVDSLKIEVLHLQISLRKYRSFTRPFPMLVLQAANAWVRSSGTRLSGV